MSTSAILVVVIVTSVCAVPVARSFSSNIVSLGSSNYVLVGGQNGTWFEPEQAPRLRRIELSNYSTTSLTPVPSEGTVWGGGWNGSQWLISGWGDDVGRSGSNPYIFLYDGHGQVTGGSLDQFPAETTWHGGDIFSASADGKEWLLSGLGSGNLTSYGDDNHMSLALFDGYNFTDLSSSVPNQRDAILYANVWNGQYWLVGGGYDDDGTLFSFNGTNIANLTAQIAQAVRTFGSVQSLAWNGDYWLIGGVNFLAAYTGREFIDLTDKLDNVLAMSGGCCSSVNTIAWNGIEWLLGGGTPVAQTGYSHAWLVEYAFNRFTDLTPEISPPISGEEPNSSILSIAVAGTSWVIGGYLKGRGSLLEYSERGFTNLSDLVSDFTYVNWVGVAAVGAYNREVSRPYTPLPIQGRLAYLPSQSAIMNINQPKAAGVYQSVDNTGPTIETRQTIMGRRI